VHEPLAGSGRVLDQLVRSVPDLPLFHHRDDLQG
jgi:hypothetical protein